MITVMSVDERPAHDTTAPNPAALTTSLLIAIILVAANLRAGLTGVGPLLPSVEHSTGLSETWGGLLVTLPLLTFATTSPLAGRAARRHGAPRVLALSLPLLAAGLVVRSLPGTVFLFGGTIVIAAAIAAGNVLLPVVVRSSVPERRIGQVTGIYVTAMGLVAAISSGVSVPLADVLPGGWRSALGCWAVLAVLAIPAWLPHLRRERAQARPRAAGPAAHLSRADEAPGPWRSALAWQVSLFMGLQSFGFYATIAWLPSIVHDHGTPAATAGWELFLFQAVGLLASITLPLLTRRQLDQRLLAATASVLGAAGFALLAVAPRLALVTCVLNGFGERRDAGAGADVPRRAGLARARRRRRWRRWPSPSATWWPRSARCCSARCTARPAAGVPADAAGRARVRPSRPRDRRRTDLTSGSSARSHGGRESDPDDGPRPTARRSR